MLGGRTMLVKLDQVLLRDKVFPVELHQALEVTKLWPLPVDS